MSQNILIPVQVSQFNLFPVISFEILIAWI